MSAALRRRLGVPMSLLALLLSTAACGARWTDEQAAEVAARMSTGTSVSGTAEVAASEIGGDRRSQPTGNGEHTADRGAETGGADRESAGGTEGRASTGQSGQSGSGTRPCEAPSDAPGVTDDEIVVGSISSLTGPVAGLGASSAGAARAYVAYLNADGGVCGRRVVLKEGDDGTDAGRYRSLVGQLAPDVLGLAGGFALGDVGGTDVVRTHALPIVNVPSGDAVTELPTAFDINPPYPDRDAVIGKYRYLRDRGASKVSMVYLAVDQSRAEAQLHQQLMEAAGLRIVQVQELPIATLSYDAAARGVANSGADYLFFIGDARGNASMARSMADADHRVRFAEYFTFSYGTDFIEAAGAEAAEGALSWIRTLPNEEAGDNQEMARFLEWMDRTAPNDVNDVFAADSWAGAKAFFEALASLPGPITRQALVAQLRSMGTYDAGGMLGPIELGAERTNGCFVAMQVRSGTWTRVAPSAGFLC